MKNFSSSHSLLESLVYLDTGYIADLHESVTGESPKTQITKNLGKKAGVNIPMFSAEVNAQETRSFTVSSFEMLSKNLSYLEKSSQLEPDTFTPSMPSKYGWISGELTVFKVNSNEFNPKTQKSETLTSDGYFRLRVTAEIDFAFITTPEYFAPGIATFLNLQNTLLKEMSIPVRAFIRVVAARSHVNQWVAIPLVILERLNEI